MQREKNPHKNDRRKLKSEILTDTPVKKFAAVNEKHQKQKPMRNSERKKENQAQKEKPSQKKNPIQKEKLKQKENPIQKEKLAQNQRKEGSKRESETFLRRSLNQKHVLV